MSDPFRKKVEKWFRKLRDSHGDWSPREIRSLLRFLADDRVLGHGPFLWEFGSWVECQWRKLDGPTRGRVLARLEALLLRVRQDRESGAYMIGDVLVDPIGTVRARRILEKAVRQAASDHGKISAAKGLVRLAKRRPQDRKRIWKTFDVALAAEESPRMREILVRARTAVGRREPYLRTDPPMTEEEREKFLQWNWNVLGILGDLAEMLHVGKTAEARLEPRYLRQCCLYVLESGDPRTVGEVEEEIQKRGIRLRGRKATLRRVVGEILAREARKGTIERVRRGRYRLVKP